MAIHHIYIKLYIYTFMSIYIYIYTYVLMYLSIYKGIRQCHAQVMPSLVLKGIYHCKRCIQEVLPKLRLY